MAAFMSPDDYKRASNNVVPIRGGHRYPAQAYSTIDLVNDVGFPEFMRGGGNIAGASVTRRSAMRNAAVKRCVNLLSNAIGMLPLHLLREGDGGKQGKAKEHPLYTVLALKPNTWQTAFEFRKLMQRRALIDGNAYAQIMRTGERVTGLVPLAPDKVKCEQRDDWTLIYRVQNKNGGERALQARDVFHLRGDTDDGVCGIALVDEAADVLGLSMRADEAAARLFRNGAMIRDILKAKKKLTPEAINNLRLSLDSGHVGADNAARTLVLEEDMDYEGRATNARESQHLETRAHQIEEIARIFGVPRPFLMMDDTSWGSGIEQLGIFFVQYGLAPWFSAWEQAIQLSLLTEMDRRSGMYPKFNERALLRGSMKDQGEFLAKLMGSGGSPQIAEQNEARAWLDLPEHPDGFGLNGGSVNGGADDGATGED